MKVKEFIRFNVVPEEAIRLLSVDINNFLKEDRSTEVISLSHSVADSVNNQEVRSFIATALLCYR
jgi:hypothetical protein